MCQHVLEVLVRETQGEFLKSCFANGCKNGQRIKPSVGPDLFVRKLLSVGFQQNQNAAVAIICTAAFYLSVRSTRPLCGGTRAAFALGARRTVTVPAASFKAVAFPKPLGAFFPSKPRRGLSDLVVIKFGQLLSWNFDFRQSLNSVQKTLFFRRD